MYRIVTKYSHGASRRLLICRNTTKLQQTFTLIVRINIVTVCKCIILGTNLPPSCQASCWFERGCTCIVKLPHRLFISHKHAHKLWFLPGTSVSECKQNTLSTYLRYDSLLMVDKRQDTPDRQQALATTVNTLSICLGLRLFQKAWQTCR